MICAVSHKHVCVLWVDWSWQRCSPAVDRWISLCAAGHSSHTAAVSGLILELVWSVTAVGSFSNHSVNLHLWSEWGIGSHIFEMLINCKPNRQLTYLLTGSQQFLLCICWVFRWFYILLRWWEWQKPKHLFKIWGDKYFLLIWPSFYFLLFTFFIWPSFSLSVYNYNKYLLDTCQLYCCIFNGMFSICSMKGNQNYKTVLQTKSRTCDFHNTLTLSLEIIY